MIGIDELMLAFMSGYINTFLTMIAVANIDEGCRDQRLIQRERERERVVGVDLIVTHGRDTANTASLGHILW